MIIVMAVIEILQMYDRRRKTYLYIMFLFSNLGVSILIAIFLYVYQIGPLTFALRPLQGIESRHAIPASRLGMGKYPLVMGNRGYPPI